MAHHNGTTALELQPGLFEEILDALPDGVAVTDLDGYIVFINDRLQSLSGYARSELIGAPVEMLLPEHFQTALHDRGAWSTIVEDWPVDMDRRSTLRRQDSTALRVDVALSVVSNGSGHHVIRTIQEPARPVTPGPRDLVEERERIARELHGDVLRSLFAVGLELLSLESLLDGQEPSRRLHTCLRMLDDCILSIRNHVFDQRP